MINLILTVSIAKIRISAQDVILNNISLINHQDFVLYAKPPFLDAKYAIMLKNVQNVRVKNGIYMLILANLAQLLVNFAWNANLLANALNVNQLMPSYKMINVSAVAQ